MALKWLILIIPTCIFILMFFISSVCFKKYKYEIWWIIKINCLLGIFGMVCLLIMALCNYF